MAPKRKSGGNAKAKGGAKRGKTEKSKAEAVLPSLADSQSYCKEIGIDIANGGSKAVFQWLSCSIVFGNRISEKTTIRAAKGLINSGLTDPKSVRDSSQWDKVEALNSEGNVQRGPSMASRLESTAALILDKYEGDMENLRKKAENKPAEIRKLIKECKGIGETGVNIFCREAQLAWPELYPFADKKSLQVAGKHGFPNGSAEDLAKFCNNDRATFVTLLASMTKDELRDGGKAQKNTEAGDPESSKQEEENNEKQENTADKEEQEDQAEPEEATAENGDDGKDDQED